MLGLKIPNGGVAFDIKFRFYPQLQIHSTPKSIPFASDPNFYEKGVEYRCNFTTYKVSVEVFN